MSMWRASGRWRRGDSPIAHPPAGDGGRSGSRRDRVEACDEDPFGDGHACIGHAGAAYALRSSLWIGRASGRGIAFFATAVADGRKRRRSRFSVAEETDAGQSLRRL
ncbi:hypothetical protein [uncultured Sphingomonas sp.]|uniref:hypothetical protein n=1 Tax=uncultured Sphingomonas sp. TaxID=158754 RepID=UPI0025F88D87|nr:hypothetical protein [uncultured Sphingomonas sp.]